MPATPPRLGVFSRATATPAIAVFAIVGYFFTPASAAARYVATTGSNSSNSCTMAAHPCLTIGHAVTAASDGDTINVAPGVYPESVLVNKSLTLTGPKAGVHGNDPSRGTGEAVIVSPDGIETVLIVDAVVATVDGFDIVAPNQLNHSAGVALTDGRAGRPFRSIPEGSLTDVTVKNCILRSTQGSDLFLGEGVFIELFGDTLGNKFTIESSHIMIGGGPDDDANGHFAIYASDKWDRPWPLDSPDRIIVQNNRIEDHGQIYADGDFGLRIDGNDFSYSRWRPIELKHIERATISNNDLTGVWGVAILAQSQAQFGTTSITRNVEIFGNTIRNIQYSGHPGFQDESGIIIGGATNVSVHNNFIENNARYGIVVAGTGFDYFPPDFGSDAAVGTQPSGISIENNSIVGNGTGLHVDSVTSPAIVGVGNWWGYLRGPLAAANPGTPGGGRGDVADAGVSISPWRGSGVDGDIAPGFQPTTLSYGVANHLRFTAQPATVLVGAPLAPQPGLEADDVAGNLAINYDGSVLLTPAAGAIAGTNQFSLIDGSGNAAGLAIETAQSADTLTASASSVTSAISTPFDVVSLAVADQGTGSLMVNRTSSNPDHVDLSFGDIAAPSYNVYVSNAPATNPFLVGSSLTGARTCGAPSFSASGTVVIGDFDPAAGVTGDTSILFLLVSGDGGPRTEGSLGADSNAVQRTADSYCNR